MSDENSVKNNIIQNIIDKKFTKANSEFGDMMRNKAYAAIDNFKQSFKYVVNEPKPVETPKED